MRYTPFVAAMALAVLGACGGNKDNASGGQPATTTDTSAGAMSSPAPTTTPPAATPAPGTATTPDSSAMPHDTSMKKMSGRKHHKASSDTTAH